MSHLVLFHRPERSFKTDKVGSVKLHLRNHHRNHVVYARMHVLYGFTSWVSNYIKWNAFEPSKTRLQLKGT